MNKNCYIYVRVSTDEQAKEGFSIEAQKEICRKKAKELDLKVLEVFADEGQSATAANRPAFLQMVDNCEQGSVGKIIVYHTDRFARNELDHAFYKEKLRKLDVQLISICQQSIDDSPEGYLLDGMMANINAYYSRDLSRKTKRGVQRKWDEGWWPGWAPHGYKNIKRGNRKIVVPDPKIAPYVIMCFRLYATGTYTFLGLCEYMTGKGMLSKMGKPMSVTSMQEMISNPFYYGLMRSKSKGEKMGNHKPLITKALYDQCIYRAAQHRQFLTRKRKYNFLLRGLIFCELHEKRLVAEWHDANSQYRDKIGYYHCCQRGGCKGSFVQIEKLEASVAKKFKRFQFSPEFIKLVKQKTEEYFSKGSSHINSERQALINKRKGLEKKRDGIEDMFFDGKVKEAVYNRQHARIEAQIRQIEDHMSELEQKYKVDTKFVSEILSLTSDIYQTYLDAPDFIKRYYIRFFFEKLYVKNKKISKVTETPVFSTLRKQHALILRTTWLDRWDDFRTTRWSGILDDPDILVSQTKEVINLN